MKNLHHRKGRFRADASDGLAYPKDQSDKSDATGLLHLLGHEQGEIKSSPSLFHIGKIFLPLVIMLIASVINGGESNASGLEIVPYGKLAIASNQQIELKMANLDVQANLSMKLWSDHYETTLTDGKARLNQKKKQKNLELCSGREVAAFFGSCGLRDCIQTSWMIDNLEVDISEEEVFSDGGGAASSVNVLKDRSALMVPSGGLAGVDCGLVWSLLSLIIVLVLLATLSNNAPLSLGIRKTKLSTIPSISGQLRSIILSVLIGRSLGGTCDLPADYTTLFGSALDSLEAQIVEVTEAADEIGLTAVGNSIMVSEFLNFKEGIFDNLFGNEAERLAWLDVGPEGTVDLSTILSTNKNNLIGAPELQLECSFNETQKRFHVDASVRGSAAAQSLSGFSSAQVSFLPDSEITVSSTPKFDIAYELSVPLVVDLNLNKFTLQETTTVLDVTTGADLQVDLDLPLLSNAEISFTGNFTMSGNFAYSSIHKWSASGGYEATLTSSDDKFGLSASDANMFDGDPPSVNYNFDICGLTDELNNAIDSFELDSAALESMMDKYILSDSIVSTNLIDRIKEVIVGAATSKVNTVKTGITTIIGNLALDCSNRRRQRRLGRMELAENGQQRMLSTATTFGDLSKQILDFDSALQSAVAGYFPGRQEVALDVVINVASSLTPSDFQTAVDTLFDDLGPAKAMFGAGNEVVDVTGLLNSLITSAEFKVSMRYV